MSQAALLHGVERDGAQHRDSRRESILRDRAADEDEGLRCAGIPVVRPDNAPIRGVRRECRDDKEVVARPQFAGRVMLSTERHSLQESFTHIKKGQSSMIFGRRHEKCKDRHEKPCEKLHIFGERGDIARPYSVSD